VLPTNVLTGLSLSAGTGADFKKGLTSPDNTFAAKAGIP